MGALNMVGVFGLPMLASAAFNVTSILLGLLIGYFIDPSFGPKALYGFACGVTIGGMAQIAVQLPQTQQNRLPLETHFQWDDPRVRKIWGLMLPSVLASGVTQFTIFINTGFALDLQKGSVTALTTAFRLWQLPVGLFGVATGMVVLPAVSRMMVGDGRKEVAVHIAKGLRLVAFFAVPAFLILSILGTEFVSAVYQWGRFNQEAVRYTGEVLGAYSLGLLGYAGTKVVQPVFLALEKRWVPLIAAAVALAISIGLNYCFVYILHKNAAWLALTTSVVTTFNFLFYFFLPATPAGRRRRTDAAFRTGQDHGGGNIAGGRVLGRQGMVPPGLPELDLPGQGAGDIPGLRLRRHRLPGGGFPAEDAGAGSGARQIPETLTGKIPSIEGGTPSAKKKEWPPQAFSLPGVRSMSKVFSAYAENSLFSAKASKSTTAPQQWT